MFRKCDYMDLRKEKTVSRIKNGFKSLIKNMNYSSITIQDILDTAEVGRTTFYMHYKSKDEVLKSIINDIFIYEVNPAILNNKNIKGDTSFLEIINHILYHFLEDKDLLNAILSSESHNIFLQSLNEQFSNLIADRMLPYYTADNVPDEVLLNHLSTSLTEIILWWITKNNCKTLPEEISYYYFSLVMPALTTKGFSFSFNEIIKKIN